MRQSSRSSRQQAHVNVIGAGIAGTWQALTFAKAGYDVTLFERSDAALTLGASHWAGGMLAPYCESESAEPVITRLGLRSLELWRDELPDTPCNGSLVVAHARDRADFERFARQTTAYERVARDRLATLEPDLDGRFGEALFFASEGHVEPRLVMPQLHQHLRDAGVAIHFDSEIDPQALDGLVVDCRGLAARGSDTSTPQSDLRGVKGEMVIVETSEIALKRPVRLLHPRWPLYIVPRANNRFMIGATSIESEDTGVTVRSVMELLSAAYAVHPAFAEARIVEFGAGLRPAFPDNLPHIAIDGDLISVNGLYRHGFLLAPALAEMTLGYVERGAIDNEVMRCR